MMIITSEKVVKTTFNGLFDMLSNTYPPKLQCIASVVKWWQHIQIFNSVSSEFETR